MPVHTTNSSGCFSKIKKSRYFKEMILFIIIVLKFHINMITLKEDLIWNENRVKPPSKIWYHLVNISLQINIKSIDKIRYFRFCLFCYIVRQTMSSNEQSLVQAGWAGFSGVKSISWCCWCGNKHKIDIPFSLLICVFYLDYVNMLQIIMKVGTHAT